jgi:putative tryptophan/tyrosine transport system substrate-binding protein
VAFFLPGGVTSVRRVELAALVAQCKLPAIYPLSYFCKSGGLMSYGVSINKIVAGAASYVRPRFSPAPTR